MRRKKNDADYETQHVVQHFDLSESVELVHSFNRSLAFSIAHVLKAVD